MQHKVEICGVNTSKLKVLKNDETQALLLRAKAGDQKAREELIAGNLRLVLSVIQRFTNRGENADDLFQVGCIGLIKAIDNFNTDLNVKFSTYGVPMIVGEIRRYLRDNSTMRVSRAMRDTAYKVLQAKERYMAQHQKEPTVEEIAKLLDIPREEVVFALDAIFPLRAGLFRQRGQPVRHGPGEGQQEQRRGLGGAHRPEGGGGPPHRPGAENLVHALFSGEDPDGGVRRNRHLPGPGVPAGEERVKADPKRAVKNPPGSRRAGRILLFGEERSYAAAEVRTSPLWATHSRHRKIPRNTRATMMPTG